MLKVPTRRKNSSARCILKERFGYKVIWGGSQEDDPKSEGAQEYTTKDKVGF